MTRENLPQERTRIVAIIYMSDRLEQRPSAKAVEIENVSVLQTAWTA